MTADPNTLTGWYRSVPHSARWPIAIGFGLLLVWFFGFVMWAAWAPISGAVVASGTFVATGQNKHIQHLEGGILRELLVKEGDRVEAGQALAQMDSTSAGAKLRRLVLKEYRLLAMRARLEAEVGVKDRMEVPPALAGSVLAGSVADPEVSAILERQRTELEARRASRLAEEQVLKKEIAGLEESIGGFRAQMKAAEQRMALFSEELKDKRQLVAQNLIRKPEMLALQRSEASLAGDIGEFTGRIADSTERIARADQRIVHLRSSALQDAVKELRETEAELDDVQEQIRAARDVVERIEVRAPVRGVVVKLHYHFGGAVVAPGAVILELLPVQDDLVVEARVKPNDISHVTAGQEALIRLPALNQRITPAITGKVVYLSADALNERTERQALAKEGAPVLADFYVARVRLDEDDVRARLGRFVPTPGMPADVYIRTGERTFFEYIMRPVYDSLSRAFREA
jgi:HlyD family type I secretion membrane fusion protein